MIIDRIFLINFFFFSQSDQRLRRMMRVVLFASLQNQSNSKLNLSPNLRETLPWRRMMKM